MNSNRYFTNKSVSQQICVPVRPLMATVEQVVVIEHVLSLLLANTTSSFAHKIAPFNNEQRLSFYSHFNIVFCRKISNFRREIDKKRQKTDEIAILYARIEPLLTPLNIGIIVMIQITHTKQVCFFVRRHEMKVLFKQTINDMHNYGNTFFKGRTYELSNERVAELASVFPEAIVVLEDVENKETSSKVNEPKKKSSKKSKKQATPEEDEQEYIETPIEG